MSAETDTESHIMYSLWSTLCLALFSLSGQEIITAKSGQDNITLPCQAPNNKTTHVEWRRTDLWKEYVLLYRDEKRIDPDNQHPSFVNRVDLQDGEITDGDVSLILKHVTANDTGTYHCRVVKCRQRLNIHSPPISSIQGCCGCLFNVKL
uniref:Ig-like domain-containing protein n=1 Tax=Oreochromis niloticus TaxID=8128 RepID=A0A669DD86_ORENI